MTTSIIGAGLGIVKDITGVVSSRLNESLKQRYNNEAEAKLTAIYNAVAGNDSPAIDSVVRLDLLKRAGFLIAAPSVDDKVVGVPVADFLALASVLVKYVHDLESTGG